MNSKVGWTTDTLGWLPWLPFVTDETATPAQAEALKATAPTGNPSDYFRLLAHDAPVLRERTQLFNAIMYGRGGASRAERELAAVATSRVNGCVYCASVHARLFNQLTKSTETIQSIFDDGVEAEIGARERAVVDYAVKLTRDPAGVSAADLEPLRALGASDAEILDITHGDLRLG
jgi:uncharacterized peroxidase-related enzyme